AIVRDRGARGTSPSRFSPFDGPSAFDRGNANGRWLMIGGADCPAHPPSAILSDRRKKPASALGFGRRRGVGLELGGPIGLVDLALGPGGPAFGLGGRRGGGRETLLQAHGLARTVAEVIQLGPADLARTLDDDVCDPGGVDR